MAGKAKPRVYAVRMTRGTKLMLKMVAKDERLSQGEVIRRLLSRHLDIKDNKPENRSRARPVL